MIFLMSAKQWSKNKKKLVIPKDYIIFDATDDDDAKMSSYTNCVTMDAFNPPVKLVKLVADEESTDIIDIDKLEKLEKNFFKGLSLRSAMMATVSGIIQNGDINIFIVMRNKAFKYYRKKMKKMFEKLFPVDFEFIEIFSGEISDHKKSLKVGFNSYEVSELSKWLKKREKENTEIYKKKKDKRKR